MSRKSKRQLALTHNCRHVVEFSAEPGNLKTIIQMISLCAASSSSSKSLLWLAMIFPTLEFLISRCEHQFDVHQSPPAKYTVRRQSKPTRYTRINHEKAILFAGNKKCKQDFRYLKSDRCLDSN